MHSNLARSIHLNSEFRLRSSCILGVSTEQQGGQTEHFASEDSTTRRSDRAFYRSARYHTTVRSSILPVSTVPHDGQIEHSTGQHGTTRRSDRAFYRSARYHTTVRSSIPPVSTVPHDGQIEHSTSQHSPLSLLVVYVCLAL